MPGKTHLEYDVEVAGKRIKILGIPHPQMGQLKPELQGIITRTHASNRTATLYSEGKNESFLPAHLIENAQALEEEPGSHLQNLIFVVGLRKLKLTNEEWLNMTDLQRRRKMREMVDDITRSNKETLRQTGKSHLKLRDLRKDLSELIVYRSLKMADRLLQTPHNNIIAVVGTGHADAVRKFLENPKLRERYRKLWEKPVAP